MEVGVETTPKRKKLREAFSKTLFQVGHIDLKKYRNKAEMKEPKKTTLLRKNGGKESQEDYPTCTPAVYFCKCRVVLSFLSAIVP